MLSFIKTAVGFIIVFCAIGRASFAELEKCPFHEAETFEVSPKIAEIIKNITVTCHYDKQQPPPQKESRPFPVHVKIYVYFFNPSETDSLFNVYMLLQCRFTDSRLRFDPNLYNVTEIKGTKGLSQMLWIPHIYFNNEKESRVMGPGEDEVMIHVHHDGTVLYTMRVLATLFCWMKLHKFPFDSQECTMIVDTWSFNSSQLYLQWEEDNPIICHKKQLSLTEFTLRSNPVASQTLEDFSFHKGAAENGRNYSSLLVTFHLQRESGFYIYDYFIPSILLVVVSWVSFWLEPEEPVVSGRVILGCSTMLTFIILAHQTGNSLPKVSYIKASEIWFLGCTAFIFGSLVEFAFVNIIYRSRRKHIGLKKVNSKYVLKETLTPKSKRLTQRYFSEGSFQHASLHRKNGTESNRSSMSNKSQSFYRRNGGESNRSSGSMKIPRPPTILTPKEVSNWIDRRSRIGFPLSFLIFNICYWMYVYYF